MKNIGIHLLFETRNLINNEFCRRRVLDPPNYMEQTPALVQPSTITDAAPDYTTLNIKVKIGTEIRGIAQNAYPNRNRKPRGQALIINYDRFTNASPRIGSEKDVIHLDQLLQQLGYTVTLKTNLNLAVSFIFSLNIMFRYRYFKFLYFLMFFSGNLQ